jgi:hypothetical protein
MLLAKEDNMRQARLKPDYQDTWHHWYNRCSGSMLNNSHQARTKRPTVA